LVPRRQELQQRHQQILAEGIDDLLKLGTHHYSNRQVEGIALLEEKLGELTQPTTKRHDIKGTSFKP